MANNQQLLMGEGAGGAPVVYVEDVFSTYLYTGNGTSQTITNNIDLSTKGGMVWIKQRDAATYTHNLVDTARGFDKYLYSSATNAQETVTTRLQSFNSTGFSLGSNLSVNGSGNTMASWTFRKQPKFFDVVTYTGDGVAGRTVAHNLGSVPGCIIVKMLTLAGYAWRVYHVGANGGVNPQNYAFKLNDTTAQENDTYWNNTAPTSTNFTVGYYGQVNASGESYVAYLFAHNAGGFGLSGTDNVISCGSYTGAGSPYTGGSEVTLGYEPQWVLIKSADNATDWVMIDNMRGWGAGTSGLQNWLYANTSGAENTGGQLAYITSTGFKPYGASLTNNTGTYIYIAIRRGPMKVPTVGTSVFSPVLATVADGTGAKLTTSFPIDLQVMNYTPGTSSNSGFLDRLRGIATTTTQSGQRLISSATSAEATASVTRNWDNTGFEVSSAFNNTRTIYWNFQRAPGFFDEVCYTVSGFAANNVSHNLTVTPELFITKPRGSAGGWSVYGSILGATTKYMSLQADSALQTSGGAVWAATSSTFSEPSTAANGTYVCYLFATCAGVSKVGSYTGNGSSQTIACGFTAGSRFVLIKRTDSTGDWYVWDSARGIVAGNDPHLSLNTTAAEVTTDDSVDTDNSGFIVNQDAATNVNVTSATYIFLAIA